MYSTTDLFSRHTWVENLNLSVMTGGLGWQWSLNGLHKSAKLTSDGLFRAFSVFSSVKAFFPHTVSKMALFVAVLSSSTPLPRVPLLAVPRTQSNRLHMDRTARVVVHFLLVAKFKLPDPFKFLTQLPLDIGSCLSEPKIYNQLQQIILKLLQLGNSRRRIPGLEPIIFPGRILLVDIVMVISLVLFLKKCSPVHLLYQAFHFLN